MSRGSATTLLGTVASGLELNTLVPGDEGRLLRVDAHCLAGVV